MKGRTVLRVVVIVIAASVLAWQNYAGKQRRSFALQSAEQSAASLSAETQLPNPALRHWQFGSVDLVSCELGHLNSGETTAAWCTNFDVAENPAQPDARHIKLHLAVLRSDAVKPDPDMVVMIAGGPGGAATQSFADTSAYAGVLKHHNVLLLDQRGTGQSNPLSCNGAANGSPEPQTESNTEDARKRVAQCLAEVQKNADPRFYTTSIAITDLEQVRAALGVQRFDLIGVSYGTRVAQQYLMRHPDHVRSVVLDSPVPNQLILGEGFAANLESALKLYFADCVATQACKQAYGDPMQALYKLRDKLRTDPSQVTFRDPRTFTTVTRKVTPASLVSVVRLFAYAPETAALLPLSIDAAARGDFAPLLGQERLLTSDLANEITGAMGLSVVCSEDADPLQTSQRDADTLLGNLLVEQLKTRCEVWPHGAMPPDFHAPLKSDKPILILSGARDPVTPPKYGEQILQGLSNGRQLVLKGQGHSALFRGCVPKLIEKFIDTPEPKNLDASCLDRLGPTPAFISFNGATP